MHHEVFAATSIILKHRKWKSLALFSDRTIIGVVQMALLVLWFQLALLQTQMSAIITNESISPPPSTSAFRFDFIIYTPADAPPPRVRRLKIPTIWTTEDHHHGNTLELVPPAEPRLGHFYKNITSPLIWGTEEPAENIFNIFRLLTLISNVFFFCLWPFDLWRLCEQWQPCLKKWKNMFSLKCECPLLPPISLNVQVKHHTCFSRKQVATEVNSQQDIKRGRQSPSKVTPKNTSYVIITPDLFL